MVKPEGQDDSGLELFSFMVIYNKNIMTLHCTSNVKELKNAEV